MAPCPSPLLSPPSCCFRSKGLLLLPPQRLLLPTVAAPVLGSRTGLILGREARTENKTKKEETVGKRKSSSSEQLPRAGFPPSPKPISLHRLHRQHIPSECLPHFWRRDSHGNVPEFV